jgi:hypothetical protein
MHPTLARIYLANQEVRRSAGGSDTPRSISSSNADDIDLDALAAAGLGRGNIGGGVSTAPGARRLSSEVTTAKTALFCTTLVTACSCGMHVHRQQLCSALLEKFALCECMAV